MQLPERDNSRKKEVDCWLPRVKSVLRGHSWQGLLCGAINHTGVACVQVNYLTKAVLPLQFYWHLQTWWAGMFHTLKEIKTIGKGEERGHLETNILFGFWEVPGPSQSLEGKYG